MHKNDITFVYISIHTSKLDQFPFAVHRMTPDSSVVQSRRAADWELDVS